ncbi:hypothetical protein FA15DRAFT_592490, partial [Coprinopsis marcescibilis]
IAHPTGDCKKHRQAMSVIITIAIGSYTFLVLLRIRALLHGMYGLPWMFTAVWLAHIVLVFLSKAVLRSDQGVNVGPTGFCMPCEGTPYYSAASAVLCFYSTAVFVATSCRLLSISSPEASLDLDSSNPRGLLCRIKHPFSGKYLPPFSKNVLRGGQLYYFMTLVSSILCVVMPVVTETLAGGSALELPNTVIMNIMICRIYRNAKLTPFNEEKDCDSFIMKELAFSPPRPDADSQPCATTTNLPGTEAEHREGDLETGRCHLHSRATC